MLLGLVYMLTSKTAESGYFIDKNHQDASNRLLIYFTAQD